MELARCAVQEYLERELLTREKGLQGVIFALQANFGMSEKRTVELGPRAAQAMAAGRMSENERRDLLRAMTEDATRNEDIHDQEEADESTGRTAD